MYSSTFVRYERNGNKVTPVRVTKQWTSIEVPNRDSRKEPEVRSRFKAVRVTQLGWHGFDRMPAADEPKAEPWQSSHRVESRERMLTLFAKDGEPVLQEAGYDQCWLPLGDLSQLTAAQEAQTLDTQWGGE